MLCLQSVVASDWGFNSETSHHLSDVLPLKPTESPAHSKQELERPLLTQQNPNIVHVVTSPPITQLRIHGIF